MADRWGIEGTYIDAAGDTKHVADEAITRLRGLVGEPPRVETGPMVVRPGEPLPRKATAVVLEDGTTVDPVDELPLGYHTVVDDVGRDRCLIVTPGRCHLPGTRGWGWGVQLYAARSRASWGMGDLGDLRRIARWSSSQGASFVLINPIGATVPVGTVQPSPYFPTSRRFRSPLYLRVEAVPGADRATDAVATAANAGRALNDDRRIDRARVWHAKLDALEAIWAAGGRVEAFECWRREQPPALASFARWSVLAERHGPSWPDWPVHCRHPSMVADVVDEPRERFHAWLQWLLELQLDTATREVSIIQDLPIGVDPGGFDAWEWQDTLALDASVGAPPDEFNAQGQDWGLPPFVPWKLRAANYKPFIETVRASVAVGGGLRVDHVMGLFRLWWIPEGASASDGAYVRYPADDLLGILALESQRHRALVVGEDLGTVEEDARVELARHDVLSYRLLWFEEDDPSTWPTNAMAAVTTHDLPTVAGLWTGNDLQHQRDLGLDPNEASTNAIRDRLANTAGLDDDAPAADAVTAAHGLLAQAPCLLLCATLDDAAVTDDRPNVPGADDDRPNWELALPLPLENLETSPVTARIAQSLGRATASTPTNDDPPEGAERD